MATAWAIQPQQALRFDTKSGAHEQLLRDASNYQCYESPVGPLWLTYTDLGVCEVSFRPPLKDLPARFELHEGDSAVIHQAIDWLAAYFRGIPQPISAFPIESTALKEGTAFQQAVWQALQQIPYGQTQTYGQVAQAIGRPAAVRAVGQANRANPLAIVIPCHRVIGANGQLTGYMGADGATGRLDIKAQLLALEVAKAL
jgi:methylated-DNA-[protein]-cysteine S-methyltransferase